MCFSPPAIEDGQPRCFLSTLQSEQSLHSCGLQRTSLIRRISLVAHNLSPKNLLLSYLRFSDPNEHTEIASPCLWKNRKKEKERKSSLPSVFKHLPSMTASPELICTLIPGKVKSSSSPLDASSSSAPELVKQMKQLSVIRARYDKGIE